MVQSSHLLSQNLEALYVTAPTVTLTGAATSTADVIAIGTGGTVTGFELEMLELVIQ